MWESRDANDDIVLNTTQWYSPQCFIILDHFKGILDVNMYIVFNTGSEYSKSLLSYQSGCLSDFFEDGNNLQYSLNELSCIVAVQTP